MTDAEVECLITRKGLNSPRITASDVQNNIVKADYYVFPDSTTTICMLTLRNKFTVIGTASCVSSDNFDAEIGRGIAYNNAKNKVWELLGFLLANELIEKEENEK